ncbi:hypothetical protein TNCV_29911 [Trichonephila clavipes]|nr:hypothetical protein TNCV_29911 [Trichonephila clavipes]
MYLIFFAEEYPPSQNMTSTRESKPVEILSVKCCLNSQSHVIAGKDDHQHLFFPSVSVWRKIHLYGWHCSKRFFPYRDSEHVKPHRVLPIKVQFAHLSEDDLQKMVNGPPFNRNQLNACPSSRLSSVWHCIEIRRIVC